jgi:hypothetical protein
MPSLMKYLIDAGAGFALFVVLLLVFVVDHFFVSRVAGPSANTLNVVVTESSTRQRGGSKRLKLAVTPTGRFPPDPFTNKVDLWDDMGKLLNELGEGYRYDEITEQQILSKEKNLQDYDVLFLTCAGGGSELESKLRSFVTAGGIVYASDWRYDAIAKAFPDLADNNLQADGERQELDAAVVDPALREVLGASTIHLSFNLPEWKTAAFSGPRVKTLLKGEYVKLRSREKATAPLMVKFNVGKGTVIFTSFHNEKQNSRVEKQLLNYLVFSLVTAGIDAEIADNMAKDSFTPQSSNLLSTPKRNQSISKTYENKKKADLRFALGFRNEGAKLRFNVKSPDGKEYTWEGTSTVILDVPNAGPGTWTYTVTDLVLPYENFPFTMTVAEKK